MKLRRSSIRTLRIQILGRIPVAKPKCDKHKRHVRVVNGKLLHKDGWGTICDSPTVVIWKSEYTAQELIDSEVNNDKK